MAIVLQYNKSKKSKFLTKRKIKNGKLYTQKKRYYPQKAKHRISGGTPEPDYTSAILDAVKSHFGLTPEKLKEYAHNETLKNQLVDKIYTSLSVMPLPPPMKIAIIALPSSMVKPMIKTAVNTLVSTVETTIDTTQQKKDTQLMNDTMEPITALATNGITGSIPSLESETEKTPQTTMDDVKTSLNTLMHESWFQDQFMDSLLRNIRTQEFNRNLETNLFSIFNDLLSNIKKNESVIVSISIFKNNFKFFEEMLYLSMYPDAQSPTLEKLEEDTQLYTNNENVFRTSDNIKTFCRKITINFLRLIKPSFMDKELEKTADKATEQSELAKASYLLDLQKEKEKVDAEQATANAEKKNARKATFDKMVMDNVIADSRKPITDEEKAELIKFFVNMDMGKEGAIIRDGEKYNETIVNSITESIKTTLETDENRKELTKVILTRFDFMLKNCIDVMQNNGILKLILSNLFEKYPFLFVTINRGIEMAFNKKIKEIAVNKEVGQSYSTLGNMKSLQGFQKMILETVIEELTKDLEINIPAQSNPAVEGATGDDGYWGGSRKTHRSKTHKSIKDIIRRKMEETHHTRKKKTRGGWLW